ncbi:MAG: Mrp/NBP35 family ATP-binding protein [Chloroflexi bacterium]|nr:Mrp/NBP35 family ATP-binding protein [Chloroflexota bacterium]MCI0577055.1 Mrp/NBP35 family ATP-binding protein [Chloroflexota bacterium]MCI0728135.1 Mrp/NBP35 family ATP-binding protein [Chloroflexota bacterium]
MKNFLKFFKPPEPVTPDQVLAALSKVLEPEVNRDLVSLGMIHNLTARDGVVSFTIRLREAGTPLQVPIERRAKKAVMAIPGVKTVDVSFETTPRSALRDTSRLNLDAKSVVAVASGKGGVGKTTVAVNLAVALGQMGHRVGLLDGDIHGPNVPQMMGVPDEQPFAFGEQIFPPQAHGITVMSMGLLVPADAPVIWRGPMMHQAIRQLLRDVMWGELDYLIVDLPPGTGDVQLTLTQTLPLAGAVMVTTPQNVAFADVLKGGEMFRQLHVPVLGVIENMSYYVCPHCGQAEPIFGEGAGEQLSRQLNAPLLSRVPLDPAVRAGGDGGLPVVLAAPASPAGKALHQAADVLISGINASRSQPASITNLPQHTIKLHVK